MDKERDEDISAIRNLIEEGRKLKEKSPKFGDGIDFTDNNLIENQVECHKWQMKTNSSLIRIFGENSKQLKLFMSNFAKKFDYTNYLGTRGTTLRYFYDNISNAIAELEVLVEDFDSQKRMVNQSTINDIFDMMNFHIKVKEVSESLFKDGHYSDAISKSLIALNENVKEKTGITDRDGFDLMNHVFNEEKPILKLNELKTTSDRDEQKGFRFIFAGAMAGIRNPKVHTIIVQKDPYKTLEYLSLASLLFKRLDESKK